MFEVRITRRAENKEGRVFIPTLTDEEAMKTASKIFRHVCVQCGGCTKATYGRLQPIRSESMLVVVACGFAYYEYVLSARENDRKKQTAEAAEAELRGTLGRIEVRGAWALAGLPPWAERSHLAPAGVATAVVRGERGAGPESGRAVRLAGSSAGTKGPQGQERVVWVRGCKLSAKAQHGELQRG